eukprot:445972-Rhodomonas_salina.2
MVVVIVGGDEGSDNDDDDDDDDDDEKKKKKNDDSGMQELEEANTTLVRAIEEAHQKHNAEIADFKAAEQKLRADAKAARETSKRAAQERDQAVCFGLDSEMSRTV